MMIIQKQQEGDTSFNQPCPRAHSFRSRRHRTSGAHRPCSSGLRCCIALAWAGLIGLAPLAQAQLEEILVTATKRELRLVDVPISITTLSAADLKNDTISSLTEIGAKVPNLTTGGGSLAPSFIIRGISSLSGEEAGFAPAVGVYVDEVFMGRDRAFNTVLNDIARVEVLRGPQGTLYGKNTIAGTLNITTNRPTNDFEARGDLTAGNEGLFQARGVVSGPVVEDKLQVRLSGIYKERDGYIRNQYLGEDLNKIDAEGGRVLTVSDLTEDLRVELAADYYKEEGNSASEVVSVFGLASPPYVPVPPQDPRDRDVQFNVQDFDERKLHGYAGRIYYDIGAYQVVSITAYREYESDFRDDSDLSPNNMFDVGREENLDQFSQELRLMSPAADRLSWILGAYYYEEHLDSFRDIHLGNAFPVGITLPDDYEEAATTTAKIDNESWALFSSVKYDFTSHRWLEAGLRYTDEQKDLFYEQLPTEVRLGLINAFVVTIPATSDDYDEGKFSGDASLSYAFQPDHVGYVKFSHGFKAGGFQADVISPPPSTPPETLSFKPEYVDNYEIGYKSLWLDKRLSLNLTAFYLDFEDKQERVNTGISFVISNAASVTSYGGEIEMQFSPTERWDIITSLGLLDASYDEFPDGGGLGEDFDGNKLAGAPESSGSFAVQFHDSLWFSPDLNFFARADVDYSDNYYSEPANQDIREVESYTFFNARVGVEDHEGRWGLYLWGKNLTDDTVLGGGVNLLGQIVGRSINIGRTYGLEARFAMQ